MSEPVMPTTSFRLLHDAGACKKRYRFLAKALGGIKAYGRDTPITLLQILNINGFDDALWALRACPDSDTFARLLACDYAEHVLRIFETRYPDDYRPREAIAVSRRYARGEATDAELSAARNAAGAAAGAAAETAAGAAAGAAAETAAWAAAWTAARAAARAAAWTPERMWQEARLRELLEGGAGVMYEVRYTSLSGKDGGRVFADRDKAFRFYDAVIDDGDNDSIGIYYTDCDGAEKELAVWSR